MSGSSRAPQAGNRFTARVRGLRVGPERDGASPPTPAQQEGRLVTLRELSARLAVWTPS